MHIVHVLYDHPSNIWLGGGAAKRAEALQQFFVEKGNTVTYISGGFPGCENLPKIDGVRFEFTPSGKKYIYSRLFFSLFAGFKLKSISKREKVDLLIEDVSIFNLFFPRLFWKGKTVSLIHNYLGKQSFKKLGPLGILPYLLERHIFKTRKNYIAVSNALKQNVLQFNSKANVQVIFNGIDVLAFETAQTPRQSFKIGFIGRIEINQKGLDILVSALQILFKRHSDWNAIFIGGGKDENELRKMLDSAQIANRVEITGRIGAERFERLSECNVVCMPSRFEGWGITAIEAAALGIPVVGSNIEGLNEAVQNGNTGILLDTNNSCEISPTALAEQIEKLQNDTELYNRLSANAKLHAQEFHWNDIARQQLAFYKKIVSEA